MIRQARKLAEAHPVVDHVITSPLVRAVQTAEIWVSAGGLDPDTPVSAHALVASGPSPGELIDLVEGVASPNGLVGLVGHEPTLSALLHALVGPSCPIAAFSTGQAVLLGPPEPSGRRAELAVLRGGVYTES